MSIAKQAFIASLVAVCALAQGDAAATEAGASTGVVEEPTAEDCPFLKVFERNDAGQWQFRQPDLPKISFADVDKEAIRAWVESKETEAELQDQKWVSAW